MSSIETYNATDSSIAYSCPPEVAENDAWKTRDMSDTVGGSTARVTTGAVRIASFNFTASSTGIFITASVALLGIVVACAIAAICLRTKPKHGREETGLLARRQRVKQLEEAEAAG
ncbi:hypothetical protein JCM21900_004723 [Sporobolomyces salmonicolor]